MFIDEYREYVLSRISNNRNGIETKEMDDNVIKTSVKLHWNGVKATKREKDFNL